jgi:2-hydroxychromene-2-carboxylate isomerase
MATKKPPRWYFSLRSPYSWFAYRDLTERYADVADTIRWSPFWEPDETSQRMLDEAGVQLPIVAMSRAKNFYILQDTRRLARARGWQMSWPIDRNPCWEVAHLAYLLADDAGRGRDFVDRVYRARWAEQRDISSRDTIGEIGDALGLDGRALAAAADDPEVRRRGIECLTASYRDGLFGVPFLIHGADKFFGHDRLQAFVASVRGSAVDAVERPWQEFVDVPAFSAPGADGGPAGGCG